VILLLPRAPFALRNAMTRDALHHASRVHLASHAPSHDRIVTGRREMAEKRV